MFLLRSAFWLTVVILLIPADPRTGDPAPRVTVIEAIAAARATVADLAGFCDRNPDVCVTGSAAWQVFADKAETGVRILGDLINGREPEAVDSAVSTGTLTKGDMLPAWQGPEREI